MAVTRASLVELEAEARLIAAEVERTFAGLDEENLNRQPGPGRWSIAQCLDHLRITDEGYLELGRRLACGEQVSGWTAALPGLPLLFGNLLLGSLTPTPTRRFRAPAPWIPSSSALPRETVSRFLAGQKALLAQIHGAGHMDAERLIVYSPAARWLCYSWADALRIVIAHQRRHLNQALAVLGGKKG
jgi:hypothetical protein